MPLHQATLSFALSPSSSSTPARASGSHPASGSPTKSLVLSPERPSTTASASKHRRSSSNSATSPRAKARIAAYHAPGENNLWKLHHEEEDMAAMNKRRREMDKVPMADEEVGSDVDIEGQKEDGDGEEEEIEVEGQEPASKRSKTSRGSSAKGKAKAGTGNGSANGTGASGKRKTKSEEANDGEQDHVNGRVNGSDGQDVKAKGQPGTNRKDSPEGGGVAGKDAEKHKNAYEVKGKVASAEVAAKVDENPPLDILMDLQTAKDVKEAEKGESVVYWMRMEDLRLEDNRALAAASAKAQSLGVPLIWLVILSPGDYKMHDRAPRRIDFFLRNLRHLQPQFDELNIPLVIESYDKRLSIPRKIVSDIMPRLKANHIYGNIEYQVDELRRDIAVTKLGRKEGYAVTFVHDRLVVPPGRIKSKVGKPMSVFSPWQRQWAAIVESEPELLEESPKPEANDKSIRSHEVFGKLFDSAEIPEYVEGFKCEDVEQMKTSWPEGLPKARELLFRFFHTKARRKLLELVSPLEPGATKAEDKSRVNEYTTGRNLVDADYSSRLSPYLTSGVISARMVLNEAKKVGKKEGKLESGRDSGVGMWVQEVSWRDFYNHVLSIWPRVSMGRPFLEKFADVQWEVSEENLQAWKDGKTGYPIVDAAMRACKARGWMENRLRMVAACFLVKSLMIDWRLGEKHFMENFIDGDLAANNGGWQWTASTGTDPQPYFRIFNMLSQSEKCDPEGHYIRYWVPELKNLKGKAIHDPYHVMPSNEFKKLGYPAPIVEHKKGRERALFRYKNVGQKEDE